MHLVDLNPRWWAQPGRRGQGIVFLCPHCCETWLCIAFANPLDGGPPWELTEAPRPLWDLLYGLPEGTGEQREPIIPPGQPVVPPGFLWTRTGESFEALTLSPSVDASAAKCWHGWVRNGAIT